MNVPRLPAALLAGGLLVFAPAANADPLALPGGFFDGASATPGPAGGVPVLALGEGVGKKPADAEPDPVHPEDGSAPMGAWYYSARHAGRAADWSALKDVLAEEGVALKDIGFGYDYIQDVALFTARGTLLLQAPMPEDEDILVGLTMGVLDTEDGFARVRRMDADDAKRAGVPHREMEWTFLEGGEMITGRLADGSGYAVLSQSVISRTRLYYAHREGRELPEGGAEALIARDLGIPPENVFPVRASGHVDLVLTALPGGTVLIHDPSKVVPALDRMLAGELPPGERYRLEGIRTLYTDGYQPRYSRSAPPDIAGKPMGSPLFPVRDHERKILDAMADELKGRLNVVRAAGAFKELEDYANAGPDSNKYVGDRINFFNGFVGANAQSSPFIVTNKGRGLSALEDHWRDIVSKHGVARDRVHFLGSYSMGAGLDCAGAPAGRPAGSISRPGS